MPAGVTAQIVTSLKASLEGSGDLGAPKQKLQDIVESLELTPGTAGATEADLLFADTRNLGASATEALDLNASLQQGVGGTFDAAEVVCLFVKAAATNTNNVNVQAAAANGFNGPFLAAGDGVSIAPGEYAMFVSAAGWPVVAGTGDLLDVTNAGGGTAVDYDIVVLGRTVAA